MNTQDRYSSRVSVEQIAEAMNASPQYIRIGLQQGIFPWGYAVKVGKNSRRYTYWISRKRFEETEGIKLDGK